jgi:hypothetical protein
VVRSGLVLARNLGLISRNQAKGVETQSQKNVPKLTYKTLNLAGIHLENNSIFYIGVQYYGRTLVRPLYELPGIDLFSTARIFFLLGLVKLNLGLSGDSAHLEGSFSIKPGRDASSHHTKTLCATHLVFGTTR